MPKKFVRIKSEKTEEILAKTRIDLRTKRDIHISEGKIPAVIYEFLKEVINHETINSQGQNILIKLDQDGELIFTNFTDEEYAYILSFVTPNKPVTMVIGDQD